MNTPAGNATRIKKEQSLTELARLFLTLGLTGFGGPAVHIAMMEEAVVRKKRWMDQQHFLDMVGATNLIPGPNSTELTMHIGYERAGWKGLVVAGCCFILPAVIITAIFAALYRQYGQLPQVQPYIYGIKPAIVAVVASLMLRLGRSAIKTVQLAIIAVVAAAAVLAGANEIYVLFGCGLLGVVLHLLAAMGPKAAGFFPFVLLQLTPASFSDTRLFLIFLKIGSILYGSGYVLFAFLDAELVTRGWLSKQQLADAIAVGQFTPGPVFSSATFIGWQIGGATGAMAATTGIFLPSFCFVALLSRILPLLQRSPVMRAFLDTVNAASVAILLAVLLDIGRTTITDWRTALIALVSFGVTFYFRRLNTAYIILGGALLGYGLWWL